MDNKAIARLKGEELLLMQILGSGPSQDTVDTELDRRALHGSPQPKRRSRRRKRTSLADVA